MKIPSKFLAQVIALAALAAPAAAQVGDTGEFQVFVDDRLVGTESFSITSAGGGEVLATGRVRLRLPEGTLELDPRLRARGVGADPVEYQVDIGGTSPSRIVGTVGGGLFSAKIATGTGEELREYVVSNGAVVLDQGLAHHYYFLAQRTHSGRVPVIVPRENQQVMATVTSRGEEQVQVAGSTVSAFHLVVEHSDMERHVWVDVLNRVLRVEVPARAYRAERIAVPR